MSIRNEKLWVFGTTTMLWVLVTMTICIQVFPTENYNPWIPILFSAFCGMLAMLLIALLLATDVKEVKK